jgi:hypothetical protein
LAVELGAFHHVLVGRRHWIRDARRMSRYGRMEGGTKDSRFQAARGNICADRQYTKFC